MIHTPSDPAEYREQLRKALANRFLSDTLHSFSRAYRVSRESVYAGMDFPALAADLAGAKEAALPRLKELYNQFKERAEAAGATVHLAKDAEEANRIIANIAQDAGAQKVVKSKSMTAEETHLNDYLEARGYQVTETDLGEWIIQLRGEGPSHMVIPAIHLSRGQVADLFTQVTGQTQDPDDIPRMVQVARKRLRQVFLEADMGVSGSNFAIAENGALGLVTNEGNARLVTTLPRTHVALLGLEKLVPDLATTFKILRLLPRNATGQVISSYVTWIKGAAQCAAAPGGRKNLHIVFLDNGRLALSQDPVFREALRCIRCGACANVCPVYRQVGGHNYGHVYIGAIGLILTHFYHGRENARALVRNCLNCQACKAVCPAGIDLPRLIKKTVALIEEEEQRVPPKSRGLALALHDRRIFQQGIRRARILQKPLAGQGGMIRNLPGFIPREHGFRSLPVVAKEPLRDRWPRLAPKVDNPRLKVALFGGCLIDFVYPEMAESLLRLLAGRGVALAYPLEQSCCGLPLAMAAREQEAARLARHNLLAFAPAEYDYVLTLCASCGSHLKESWPRLLAGQGALEAEAARLAEKVIDFSSFMHQVLRYEPPAKGSKVAGLPVAYHAPCHLCRGLGVKEPPRELIRQSGASYVELGEEEVCCGFGGSYSIDFPELSASILGDKLSAMEESGAKALVTDCPGCVLQLRGGLDKRGSAIEVLHMAQLLDRAARGR